MQYNDIFELVQWKHIALSLNALLAFYVHTLDFCFVSVLYLNELLIDYETGRLLFAANEMYVSSLLQLDFFN